jgi:hypothetical protein
MAEIIAPYPEGERNPEAGRGQIQDRTRAMFKVGQNGEVKSLGIELENAMVDKAAKRSKDSGKVVHDWEAIEKGMIWFERVSGGK